MFVGVLGNWVSQQIQKTPIVDDVLLENVEALANDEVPGLTICRGSGDFVCPNFGERVSSIYIGYSLR